MEHPSATNELLTTKWPISDLYSVNLNGTLIPMQLAMNSAFPNVIDLLENYLLSTITFDGQSSIPSPLL